MAITMFTYTCFSFVYQIGLEGCGRPDLLLHVHRWGRVDHPLQLQSFP